MSALKIDFHNQKLKNKKGERHEVMEFAWSSYLETLVPWTFQVKVPASGALCTFDS